MLLRAVDFLTNLFNLSVKEATSIDNLSNEVLLEIFTLLDAESLQNASLVCKNWDELIGSSAVTMRKFKLHLVHHKIEKVKLDALPLHRRKNVNLDIFYGNVFDQIVEFITRFNIIHVRKLNLHGAQAVDIGALMKFLSKMPMLESIDFSPFIVSYGTDLTFFQVVLSHLKQLEIDSVNCGALKYIVAENLKKIAISGYRVPNNNDFQSLVGFLEDAKNLMTLDLNENMFSRIFESKNQTQFTFHLKFFIMSYHCKMPDFVGKNFTSFLVSQAPSLTELNVGGTKNISNVLYTTIISNLRSLSTLWIDVSSLPLHQTFYEKLNPSTSLKCLRLYGDFPSDEAAKGFMGNCPNVEKMVLYQIVGNYINHIAAFNTKLSDLYLSSLSTSVDANARFNSLKTLTMSSIKDSEAWMSLLASSPSIESFTVEWVDQDTIVGREVEFILQQSSLRHLKFDGDYEDIKIIFDVIKTNYGRLETLELVMSNTSEYGTTVTANVKFEFPINASQWSVEAADQKFEIAWDDRSW